MTRASRQEQMSRISVREQDGVQCCCPEGCEERVTLQYRDGLKVRCHDEMKVISSQCPHQVPPSYKLLTLRRRYAIYQDMTVPVRDFRFLLSKQPSVEGWRRRKRR